MVTSALVAGGALAATTPAQAAGESVDVYLTSTSDDAGLNVTRGLQKQAPVTFTSGTASGGTTINVNPNTTYQQFEGGGASITGSTAYLFSSVLSSAKKNEVMSKLFSRTDGIGLSFVRNPIGVSDLSPDAPNETSGSMDDTCCDLNDFPNGNPLDDTVRSLTKQAQDLNSDLRVKVVPWSAPAWMKDNGKMDDRGWLKWEYYDDYAAYIVKYIQRYQAAGIDVEYLSVSNEPNCKCGNVGMEWNADGMRTLTRDFVFPALRAAGLKTKVMLLDWNYLNYDLAKPLLEDAAIRNDPNFGGIAWHGYWGGTDTGKQVHDQFPGVKQFSTEHSGGLWVTQPGRQGNYPENPNVPMQFIGQHTQDLLDITTYARGWSSSIVKWGLAMNQDHRPYNPIWSAGENRLTGCDQCTGLVTVHEGDARHGQVDYTIEYYTTGHLTKFVRPGAVRIDSTDTAPNAYWDPKGNVMNVAYKNPDGSVALIAHNPTGSARTINVNSAGQKFSYTLDARTTATFTWKPGSGGSTTPPTTGTTQVKHTAGGRCMDVSGGVNANGTAVQLWDCDANNSNQKWTFASNGTVTWNGKCLGVGGGNANDAAPIVIWNCDGSTNQKWTRNSDGTIRSMGKCLDVTGGVNANGTKLQLWSCTSGPNQRWTS